MKIKTPVSDDDVRALQINDTLEISGTIYCGRDAVLPKIVKMWENGRWDEEAVPLKGGAVFHTAVSPAGIGPTTSNKLEIESSIPKLSEAGIKLHIGKGSLGRETAEALMKNNSLFLVTPPCSALLEAKIKSRRLLAFPEDGMEALYAIEVEDFPAIVAIAHGKSVFEKA